MPTPEQAQRILDAIREKKAAIADCTTKRVQPGQKIEGQAVERVERYLSAKQNLASAVADAEDQPADG